MPMATEPAQALFDLFTSWDVLERLVNDGETEGTHLEAKAPASSNLTTEQRKNLARAASGFANTGGGVILWGVSTTRHVHTTLDVLSQVEPIGNCRRLAQEIHARLPSLTTPAVGSPPSRVITEKPGDRRGVIVTYIPRATGDPVQSNEDRQFYVRTGDDFTVMPYEVLRRMFAGSEAPDLAPLFDERLCRLNDDETWDVPFVVQNRASASARDVLAFVRILEADAVERITPLPGFRDAADVNPGHLMYTAKLDDPVHRGVNTHVGALRVLMARNRRRRRVLRLEITLYADKMRAGRWTVTVQLAQAGGFSLRSMGHEFVY
jgi:Schlafen, AlbA_2